MDGKLRPKNTARRYECFSTCIIYNLNFQTLATTHRMVDSERPFGGLSSHCYNKSAEYLNLYLNAEKFGRGTDI